MPSLIPSKLTDGVVSRYKDCPNPRLKQIRSPWFGTSIHFAREVNLTETEWIKDIEFVTKVGQFSTSESIRTLQTPKRLRPGRKTIGRRCTLTAQVAPT
jgi:catechol 2,3-dioxygenase-like protein